MIAQKLKAIPLYYLLLLLLASIIAPASISITFSIFEAILPFAIFWAIFVAAWYLAVASVATRYGDSIGGVPPMPKAAGVLLSVTILSLTMIGPMGIFYLLLFFPVVSAKAFFPPNPLQMNKPLAKALRRISLIGILVLEGLITTWIYIHSHRSRADFFQLLNPSQSFMHIKK